MWSATVLLLCILLVYTQANFTTSLPKNVTCWAVISNKYKPCKETVCKVQSIGEPTFYCDIKPSEKSYICHTGLPNRNEKTTEIDYKCEPLSSIMAWLDVPQKNGIILYGWSDDDVEKTLRKFEGLDSIQIQKSENVTKIPTESLKRPSLQKIRLYNTSISSLKPNIFKDLGLLNLTYLELSTSKLTALPANAFVGLPKLEMLSMDSNHISFIDQNALNGLSNLKNIYLNNNCIQDIPEGTFKNNTPLLQELSIDRNSIGFTLKRHLLPGLQYLKKIVISVRTGHMTLEDLALSNLTALEIYLSHAGLLKLPENLFQGSFGIKKLYLDNNEIRALPQNIFKDMKNLEELNLSNNKLKTLIPEPSGEFQSLFSSMTMLKKLLLSNNLLESLKITTSESHIFEGLDRSLVKLDLSNNYLKFDCHPAIPSGFLHLHSPLYKLKYIEELNLSHNNLSRLCQDFTQMIHLTKLEVSDNRIEAIDAIELQYQQENLVVDLQRNLITKIEYKDAFPLKANISILLSDNPFNCSCENFDFLKTLNSRFNVSNATCVQPENLKGVNLQSVSILSNVTNYSLDSLVCQIPDEPKNCECLIRRSKRRIECLCDEGVSNIPNPVNITRYNFITDPNEEQYDVSLTLLSENNLQLIPNYVSSLNLSYLHLNTIPDIPKHVKYVNLTHNNILNIPDEFLLGNVTFDFEHNEIECSCSNYYNVEKLQKLRGRINDYANLTCVDGLYLRIVQGPHLCDVYYSWVIGGSIAVTTLIIAALLIVTYIYKLQLKIFLYNKGLTFINKEEAEDANKKYDIFISFSSDDEDYVMDVLMPMLELKYKVCNHYNDFNIGEDILTQIYRSVADSRRTIIVASNGYFKSHWCIQEITAAYRQTENDQRQRAVIILRKGFDPKNAEIPEMIQTYLNLNTWIKEEISNFWEKLCYFLPRKITAEDLRIKKLKRAIANLRENNENTNNVNNGRTRENIALMHNYFTINADKKDKEEDLHPAVRDLQYYNAVCKDGKIVKNLPETTHGAKLIDISHEEITKL